MMRKLIALTSLLSVVLIQTVYAATPSATLSVKPVATTVNKGDAVTVSLLLNTGGQAVIGTKINVTFSSLLSYQSFNDEGSIFNTEVDISKVDGNTVSISRVDMNTSYLGTEGLIAKLVFKAEQTGTADITIDTIKTEVKADSDLTNILKTTENSQITITALAPAQTPPPVTQTASPTPTPTPSPTPSSTATATVTATPTPAASNKSVTATKTATPTSTAKATATTVAITTTSTPSASLSPSAIPTESMALIPAVITPIPLAANSAPTRKTPVGIIFLGTIFMIAGAGGAYYSFTHIRKHR